MTAVLALCGRNDDFRWQNTDCGLFVVRSFFKRRLSDRKTNAQIYVHPLEQVNKSVTLYNSLPGAAQKSSPGSPLEALKDS